MKILRPLTIVASLLMIPASGMAQTQLLPPPGAPKPLLPPPGMPTPVKKEKPKPKPPPKLEPKPRVDPFQEQL
ncbi:MAG: HcpA family protein, partial [Bradyrhizobium sp.]|nr:HcpA family protein [Bradyrhizobium sp.]